MAKTKPKIQIEALPADLASEVSAIADKAALGFAGSFDELEKAIGMLFLGRLFGWKVLVLLHNKRTIRKYEQILGIDIRERFPEEGPLAQKSVSYKAVKELGQFWKAVSGDLKLDNRRDVSS